MNILKLHFFLYVFLQIYVFNSVLSFAQPCQPVEFRGSLGATPVQPGQMLNTLTVNCSDTVALFTLTNNFTKPGWALQIDGALPTTFLRVYRNGQIYINDYYIPGATWPVNFTLWSSGYWNPNDVWELRLCDAGNTPQNYVWRLYDWSDIVYNPALPFAAPPFADYNNSVPYANGVANVFNNNCVSIPMTLGGSAVFSGNGVIQNNGNGRALFSAPLAGPGTHSITYCWNNGHGCNNCQTQQITVLGPIANAGTGKSICVGQSVQIGGSPTATAGAGNYTYQWSPSAGLNSVTVANPQASPSSTTTYTVTVTDNFGNGCTSTSNVTVTVNQLPTPIATNSSPTCLGGNVSFNVNIGTSWNWSGPNGFVSNLQNPQINNITPLNQGTYTVTVTDANSCQGTASTILTIGDDLQPTINSNSPICVEEDLQLSVNMGTNWTWSGPNGFSSNLQNPVIPSTSLQASGQYSVTVSENNCSGQASVAVVVNPKPTVLLTASSETICEGQSTTISATGANTYSWNQNLSNISSHVVSPNINTTYTVTGTSVHGCTGTASMLITVYENPIITVIAQPDGVCPGDTVFVSASGADTYQWNTGQTANSFQTPLFSSTTFVVTATDQNGCSATNQVFVQAFDSLQASINPINPSICLGDSMLLTVNSIGTSNQYLWNTGDTLPSIIVSPDTASSYVVTVTSPFGCIETTVTNVTVYPIPQVDFVASPTYGCVPVTVNFTNLSEQGSYVWNFGDGNTSAVANPSHTYNQHGQFTVQLTVTANNCDNSAIRYNYIDIYPKPIASFQVSSNIVYEDEPTIDFSDNSSGATSWFWNFGDGTGFSDNQHEQYTYGTVGSYQVWLIVENLWGCKDSTSQQVVVKPLVTFFIPNSFSPNADGMNDFFMPVGNNIDIENYEFSIFDRYGKRVFYTTDIQTAWDGRIHNNEIKSGVYIYDITVKLEGKTRKYRGSVLVLL